MKGKCSDRIKEALNLRNMKPIELVEQSNIKKSALSQYMSGKITPRQKALDAMAKVLNVSPAWLMGFDVPMEREGILNDAKIQETHKEYSKAELKGEFTITENINDEYIRILNVENEKANETIYNLKRNEYDSKMIDKIKISFSLNDINYTDDDVYKFIKLFKEYKQLSDDKQKEIDNIIYRKEKINYNVNFLNLFEKPKYREYDFMDYYKKYYICDSYNTSIMALVMLYKKIETILKSNNINPKHYLHIFNTKIDSINDNNSSFKKENIISEHL